MVGVLCPGCMVVLSNVVSLVFTGTTIHIPGMAPGDCWYKLVTNSCPKSLPRITLAGSPFQIPTSTKPWFTLQSRCTRATGISNHRPPAVVILTCCSGSKWEGKTRSGSTSVRDAPESQDRLYMPPHILGGTPCLPQDHIHCIYPIHRLWRIRMGIIILHSDLVILTFGGSAPQGLSTDFPLWGEARWCCGI